MTIEVDGAVLGLGSIRGRNRGAQGLADNLAHALGEIPGDRHPVGWAEANDLESDFHVGIRADRVTSYCIRHHVGRHVHLVGSLAPLAAQLLGFRVDAWADVLAIIVGIEDHDPHAIAVADIAAGP